MICKSQATLSRSDQSQKSCCGSDFSNALIGGSVSRIALATLVGWIVALAGVLPVSEALCQEVAPKPVSDLPVLIEKGGLAEAEPASFPFEMARRRGSESVRVAAAISLGGLATGTPVSMPVRPWVGPAKAEDNGTSVPRLADTSGSTSPSARQYTDEQLKIKGPTQEEVVDQMILDIEITRQQLGGSVVPADFGKITSIVDESASRTPTANQKNSGGQESSMSDQEDRQVFRERIRSLSGARKATVTAGGMVTLEDPTLTLWSSKDEQASAASDNSKLRTPEPETPPKPQLSQQQVAAGLRKWAKELEVAAWQFEEREEYALADRMRQLAEKIRQDARWLKAPSNSDVPYPQGGYGSPARTYGNPYSSGYGSVAPAGSSSVDSSIGFDPSNFSFFMSGNR